MKKISEVCLYSKPVIYDVLGVLRVTSKRSCALDGSPSCERVREKGEQAKEKHLKL
jgi:hypothetical protein